MISEEKSMRVHTCASGTLLGPLASDHIIVSFRESFLPMYPNVLKELFSRDNYFKIVEDYVVSPTRWQI